LIQGQPLPLWLSGIDFSKQDLSRVNLQDARLEHCLFAGSNPTAAKLYNSEWLSCRAAQAVFRSTTLGRCQVHQQRPEQYPMTAQQAGSRVL
jgi:uncharacterized protein YjbI with pentapeptide repeats